jgi:hypothetical protein
VKRKATGVAVLLALAIATGVHADVVYLKSGNRIEGIARIDGQQVKIESMSAEVTMPYREIERIDRDHEAPIETYRARREALLREPTPEGFLGLAAWAQERGGRRLVTPDVEQAAVLVRRLDDPAAVRRLAFAYTDRLGDELRPIWRHLMLLDPDDGEARRALGFRRVEGAWVTEEEFQVAQGNVLFEKEWIPRAERERIVAERAADLKARTRKLAANEREVRRREEAAQARERHLDAVEDRLEGIARDLERTRDSLEERERDVERRERSLNALRFCRSCGGWYRGVHLCPSSLFHCPRCNGWFPRGHRCPR